MLLIIHNIIGLFLYALQRSYSGGGGGGGWGGALGITTKYLQKKYMLFASWEVRMVKNCDQGLENAVTVFHYTDRP